MFLHVNKNASLALILLVGVVFLFSQGRAAAATPSVIHGTVPTDGHRDLNSGNAHIDWYYPYISFTPGQRLTGEVTVTYTIKNRYNATLDPKKLKHPLRLLVDGVPQPGWKIDTTKWEDGTHVLGVQIMGSGDPVLNSSRGVVFNNKGTPLQSKEGVAFTAQDMNSHKANSLAWGRVNVLDPQPYPLGHPRHTHPLPSPEDAERLAKGEIWWVEGLTHQGTMLYHTYPMLVKNAQGDYFIQNWNPQKFSDSVHSLPFAKADPQFDGPRGIATLSPYATLVAGRKVLASGYRGWVGVDITGRVVDVDLTGEVRTIFGPRSVAGKVQTNAYLSTFTLDQRVAAGEKEYVGTGERLVMPQDLWLLDDDRIAIADTGANKVSLLSRSQAKIIESHPCKGTSSVWQGFGAQWWICSGNLWTFKDGQAKEFAKFGRGFWVRGDEERGSIYVLDKGMGLYEVNPTSGAVTTRRASYANSSFEFVFMEVDVKGNAGPKGRIYFSMINSFESNTGIHYMDPGVWKEFSWLPGILNDGVNKYGSQQARVDIFGHYIWGFSIHPDESMFVSVGISNSSWKIAAAHLGPVPPLDPILSPATYNLGLYLFSTGVRDKSIGLAAIFGTVGGGGLGYSADMFRTGTINDVKNFLDPLLPADTSETERTAIATYVWAQRSRPHFPAGLTPAQPAPTLTLSASPTSVASGSPVSLTWSTTNATSCVASNAWTGAKATSGTQVTGALDRPDKAFTLTCTGSGGSTSKTVLVTVTAPLLLPASFIPSGLTASNITQSSAQISWSAPTDTSHTISGYKVFKAGTLLGTTSTRSFTVTNLAPGTSTSITVSAHTAGGRESATGTLLVTTLGTLDATPPTASISTPPGNKTVSGVETISVSASDVSGIQKVEFFVDGSFKNTDTASPYAFAWDTTNGGAHPCSGAHTHTIQTKTYDQAGNVTTSTITVKMNNPSHCEAHSNPGQGNQTPPSNNQGNGTPSAPPVVTPPVTSPTSSTSPIQKVTKALKKKTSSSERKKEKDKKSSKEKNDRQAPWLDVSGIRAGQRLPVVALLRVNSKDNHKIDSLVLFIDGKKKQKSKSPSLTYSLLRVALRGNHTIQAVATDKRGNTKTMTAAVRNGAITSIRYAGKVK